MRAELSTISHLSPQARHQSISRLSFTAVAILASVLVFLLLLLNVACRSDSEAQRVRPRQLRDVPAQRLAFNFQADIQPPITTNDEATKLPAIQQDFDTRRKNDALLRTVASPDGLRALALYGTTEETSQTFRIDLYSSDGKFLRNLTPRDLAVVFQDSVVWSPDGGYVAFVGRRALTPAPSPTPGEEELPPPSGSPLEVASPLPTSTVPPVFAPLAVFNTEQIYLCNRDGYDLKPLTRRDGLIYFALAWAPDSHALVALACKESEWDAREKEFKTPAGRPRLLSVDGQALIEHGFLRFFRRSGRQTRPKLRRRLAWTWGFMTPRAGRRRRRGSRSVSDC